MTFNTDINNRHQFEGLDITSLLVSQLVPITLTMILASYHVCFNLQNYCYSVKYFRFFYKISDRTMFNMLQPSPAFVICRYFGAMGQV